MTQALLFDRLLQRLDTVNDLAWRPALRLGGGLTARVGDQADTADIEVACVNPTTEISGCGEPSVDTCPQTQAGCGCSSPTTEISGCGEPSVDTCPQTQAGCATQGACQTEEGCATEEGCGAYVDGLKHSVRFQDALLLAL